MTAPLSSRHWFGKASAGFVLGLLIALGLAGLLSAALDVRDTYFALPGQFTMWIMSPVWCLILSLCFLFRSGRQAWAVLGAACGAIWLILFAIGSLA